MTSSPGTSALLGRRAGTRCSWDLLGPICCLCSSCAALSRLLPAGFVLLSAAASALQHGALPVLRCLLFLWFPRWGFARRWRGPRARPGLGSRARGSPRKTGAGFGEGSSDRPQAGFFLSAPLPTGSIPTPGHAQHPLCALCCPSCCLSPILLPMAKHCSSPCPAGAAVIPTAPSPALIL